MFIGPWDQGGPWSDTGIDGMHRFLGRVWHQAQSAPTGPATTGEAAQEGGARPAQGHAPHHPDVSEDYEAYHFNTAIAKLMELSNAIGEARDAGLAGSDAYAEAVDTLLLLLAPAAPQPHEELWARRGHPYSVHQPVLAGLEPGAREADVLELPVQVDGKLRDRLLVTPETPTEEIERMALASERVQAYLKGRAPRRVVQIRGKLVNVVTPGE